MAYWVFDGLTSVGEAFRARSAWSLSGGPPDCGIPRAPGGRGTDGGGGSRRGRGGRVDGGEDVDAPCLLPNRAPGWWELLLPLEQRGPEEHRKWVSPTYFQTSGHLPHSSREIGGGGEGGKGHTQPSFKTREGEEGRDEETGVGLGLGLSCCFFWSSPSTHVHTQGIAACVCVCV